VLPLLRNIIEGEDRRDRAHRHASTAVDTLHRINIELRDFLEARTAVLIRRVLLGMDAINGAGIDASAVLQPDAGFGNDIGHGPSPHCYWYP
jgi:hypothetical protein